MYLYQVTGQEVYLERARQTARFLVEHVWQHQLKTFPFEHPSSSDNCENLTYFFDTGIIIRGLIAVWRLTQDDTLLEVASAAARQMATDFHSGSDYHPILELPGKSPLSRDQRWSRSSACYQLKAAIAWWEVSQITGDTELKNKYDELLRTALAEHERFLPGSDDGARIMDRLHAYLYFLEGLTSGTPEHRERRAAAFCSGLAAVQRYKSKIASSFLRADVCSQLLRARLSGCLARFLTMDVVAGTCEAKTLATFQMESPDIRIDGGMAFGRRNGEIVAHINPWVTAFSIQALDMWDRYQANLLEPQPELLI